jgi:hypothetical protein
MARSTFQIAPRRNPGGDVTEYEKIFGAITRDPRYQRNLDWGQPRPGHPEGTIRRHIAEIERNLDVLRPKLSDAECWQLKVLIHTHDTFKSEATSGATIAAPGSHASVARAFLAEFCNDVDLLAMVQYHDEPYALWRKFESTGKLDLKRIEKLFSAIKDWNVFLAFIIVDGCAEGKSREPLRWWFRQVSGRVQSRFGEGDIL